VQTYLLPWFVLDIRALSIIFVFIRDTHCFEQLLQEIIAMVVVYLMLVLVVLYVR
jgi:hypothetical protein